MKKYLLLLLTAFSTVAFGQSLTRTATFDFANPQTGLNPPVTPEGASTQIANIVFTSGDIQLSIGYDNAGKSGTGATLDGYLETIGTDKGKYNYYLHVFPYGTVTFKGLNGATMNSIAMRDGDNIQSFRLKDGEPGSFDNAALKWVSNGSSVNSVVFKNTGVAGDIHKFTVEYSVPAVRLSPVSTSLQDGATLASFDGVTLSYPSALTLVTSSGITISYDGTDQKVTSSVLGTQVKLTPATALTTDGTVKVHIPAGCFKDASGYLNKALDYTFTVQEARNTFNYVNSDPAEDTTLKVLPANIELTFPKTAYGFSIGYVDSSKDLKLKDASGSTVCSVSIAANSNDISKVTLTTQNNTPIPVKGTYTITVPEKTVYNHQGEEKNGAWTPDAVDGRWNPEFTLTYVVDPNYVPDNSTEKMKYCRTLLQNTGVGYPALTSEGYKALQDSVAAKASDEHLDVALAKYYAETNVVMPASGKYYKVAGVNLSGTPLYLCYSNGAVTLSADTANVAHFLATVDGSTVKLATADGKYLHVLTASDGYDATSSKNVTDAETAASSLTFAKLVSADHAKEALGKMTMYGLLGKETGKLNATDVSGYAIIRYSDGSIFNDPSQISFAEDYSNAFIFEETTKASENTNPEVDPKDTLSVTPKLSTAKDTDGNWIIKLDFSDKGYTVDSKNTSGEYVEDAKGNLTAVTHTLSSTAANIVTINAGKLAEGTYKLVIPKGNLTYTKDNVTKNNARIEMSFTVGSGSTPEPTEDADFSYTYEGTQTILDSHNYYHDVDLNEFVVFHSIYGDYDDIYPNSAKKVTLMNSTTGGAAVRTGHVERYTGSAIPDYCKGIVVKFDEPIKAGDLKAGVYTFIFPKGTFGNANFGKYCEGTLTDATKCMANDRLILPFKVDNVIADGIRGISADSEQEPVIYDLSGRRLKSITKPGLYIVNGKKVIKR